MLKELELWNSFEKVNWQVDTGTNLQCAAIQRVCSSDRRQKWRTSQCRPHPYRYRKSPCISCTPNLEAQILKRKKIETTNFEVPMKLYQ